MNGDNIKDIVGYANSWELYVSFALTGFYYVMVDKPVDVKDIVSIFIPVITMFLTITSLSVMIVLSATSERFALYIESKTNAYTNMVNINILGLFIYLITIVSMIMCKLTENTKHPSISSIIYWVTIFAIIYSFMYTFELLRHFSIYLKLKIKYGKLPQHIREYLEQRSKSEDE